LPVPLTLQRVTLIVGFVLIATAIPILFFIVGLQLIGPSRAAILVGDSSATPADRRPPDRSASVRFPSGADRECDRGQARDGKSDPSKHRSSPSGPSRYETQLVNEVSSASNAPRLRAATRRAWRR